MNFVESNFFNTINQDNIHTYIFKFLSIVAYNSDDYYFTRFNLLTEII